MGIFFRIAAAGVSLLATSTVLDWFSRDQSYADVVALITKEINYAECLAQKKNEKGLGVSCDVYTPKVYSTERVKKILNTYINVVLNNGGLPEYDASSSAALNASAQTIQHITREAGENDEKTVRTVLGQLFWSTAQNRISDTSFIRPRTARNYAHSRQTPEQYKDEDKSWLDELGDKLDTVGMVFVAGAVMVLGIVVYNEVKE